MGRILCWLGFHKWLTLVAAPGSSYCAREFCVAVRVNRRSRRGK